MGYTKNAKETLSALSKENVFYSKLSNGLTVIGTKEALIELQKDYHYIYYSHATNNREDLALKYAMLQNQIDIALLNSDNHYYEEIGNK